MNDKIKCTLGDQEFFLSPEEYEDLLVDLHEKGYYISKFDMKFYEQDSTGEFTEEVKMVGNPEISDYYDTNIRGYRVDSPIIDFDETPIDPAIMEEVMKGFYTGKTL